MPELFVSYASVDRPRTLQIVEAVREQGLDVWIDLAGIAGGTSYGTEIATALRDAQAVLLIASDASLASKNVRQEIMLAWRYDKPIIPLILHPLVFPDDVAYWLEGAQWIEVLDRAPADWMPKLRQALARHGLGLGTEDANSGQRTLAPLDISGNLPTHLPPIVGRARELEEVLALLGNGRLITLTGPGGTGKTRLALEVARRLGPSLSGGAWFVDLASITSGELLTPVVASALGVAAAPDQSESEAITEAFGQTPFLLLLDNLEQVAGAADPIGSLLAAMPDLRILATSRAPIGLPSEWGYAVPQLALPNLAQLPPPAELKQNPAVGLFVERALQAKPDFQFNDGNARAIAEICHRLDGLPLAIEIAAARTRLLPPAALLTRLGSRLSVLTRGSAASGRQQTLRDTIAWSYNLLDPVHQQVFRMFGVFSGGAPLDATEAVIGPLLSDSGGEGALPMVIDIAEELVDQALVTIVQDGDLPPRLRMLETIREYALEQLTAHDEAGQIRQTHTEYFLGWLDGVAPSISSASGGEAISAIRSELGNLRSALDLLKHGSDRERWWRFANLLFLYWRINGPYTEAVHELSAIEETIGDACSVEQAEVLRALGWLAGARGDFQEADAYFTRALAVFEREGRQEQIADAHYQLAMSSEYVGSYADARRHQLARRVIHEAQGDANRVASVDHDLGRLASFEGEYDTAVDLIERGLAVYRTSGNIELIAVALFDLATIEMFAGEADASLAHIAESLALAHTLGDGYLVAAATVTRVRAQQLAGDFVAAARTIEEAQERANLLGDASVISLVLYARGTNALGLGDHAEAERYFWEDLELATARQDRWRIAEIFDRLATIAVVTGRAEQAARFLGRAARERKETGGHIPPVNLPEHEATTERARIELSDARFGELWAEGNGRDAGILIEG